MTCDAIRDGELIEAYLLGHLTEEEQARFEGHYFACDRCFEALETVRAVRGELATRRAGGPGFAVAGRRRAWQGLAWAAAVGGILLAGGIALWTLRSSAPGAPAQDRTAVVAEGPGPATPIAAPAPTEAPAPAPVAPAQPSAPPRPSLADLARFEPPPFFALTVRGDAPATPDEAFASAMARYMARDYRQARAQLASLVERDPARASAQFYLGISALQLGEVEQGMSALTATLALGESPHFEDATFFLAKAHLLGGDVARAREALDRTIGLAGEREAEARRLLKQLADR